MSEALKNKNKINKIENPYEISIFINFIKLILIFKIIDVSFFLRKLFIQSIIYFKTFLFLKLCKSF